MTESEAIEVLTDRHTSIGTTKCDDVAWRKLKPAIDTAVNALEKIQQYQAIGTVEEIKEILQIISEGQEDVDEDGISIGLLNTLLEYVEYAKIGTVEECREARVDYSQYSGHIFVEKYFQEQQLSVVPNINFQSHSE